MSTLYTTRMAPPGMSWLDIPTQPQSQGLAGRQIERNIKDIRRQEFQKLLETQPAIGTIIFDLAELVMEDEEDDYGILRPAPYAARMTLQLILNAGLQVRKRIPYAAITSDESGGIRIEWYWHDRELRLVVPASEDGQTYIYYEGNGEHNIDRHVYASNLARWLDWLANV